MNLAAIDIGTNSIHMIIVKVTSRETFEVLVQEKEMVKLGAGVFANKMLSEEAFRRGVETINRYVQLADEYGVEEIITAATSATREAKNGREFLDRLIEDVGLSPQLISGKEESRLIFLAVRKAIEMGNENALVIDIGGGSTEAVVGNKRDILYKSSMKLGVLRLLDRVGSQTEPDTKQSEELRGHIRQIAAKIVDECKATGFSKVIGTSGTIRALGEAALRMHGNEIIQSVNAERIPTKDLRTITGKLLALSPMKRAEIPGISENRVDAIHLGGLLLVELLDLLGAEAITLSDASLREGLIIDYLEKNGQSLDVSLSGNTVRERSSLHLAKRYNSDIEEKRHVARIAMQLFDQLKDLHRLDEKARELLYHACLIYDIGIFVNFKDYHKHSKYLILNGGLRGFRNAEIIMLANLARYHRKAGPKKKHTAYRNMEKADRSTLRGLAGILRIAVALDKTKNQWVEHVYCIPQEDRIIIRAFGEGTMDLEMWEGNRFADVLSKFLDKSVTIQKG